MFVCVLIFICLSIFIFVFCFFCFFLLFDIYNIQCRLLTGGHVLLNRKRKTSQVGRSKKTSVVLKTSLVIIKCLTSQYSGHCSLLPTWEKDWNSAPKLTLDATKQTFNLKYGFEFYSKMNFRASKNKKIKKRTDCFQPIALKLMTILSDKLRNLLRCVHSLQFWLKLTCKLHKCLWIRTAYLSIPFVCVCVCSRGSWTEL